jgi:hypothetical protein
MATAFDFNAYPSFRFRPDLAEEIGYVDALRAPVPFKQFAESAKHLSECALLLAYEDIRLGWFGASSITKSRKYEVRKEGQEPDLEEYLREVFSSSYSDFLLNFGMEQLINSLSD